MLRFFRYKKPNGRVLFALLDENHFPGVERTLFIHSLNIKATNSVENLVYDLRFLLNLAECYNISIERCVKVLMKHELLAFCRLYIEACKFEYMGAIEFISNRSAPGKIVKRNISNKALHNLIFAPVRYKTVSNITRNRRIHIAVRYIEFLTSQLTEFDFPEIPFRSILELLNQSKTRSRKSSVKSFQFQSVLPESVNDNLKEIIHPLHPNNPFKTSRLRNYLIISILLWGGIRRSACMKLRIGDFDFTGDCNIVYITRTPDSKDDPRIRPPAQKTREHIMVLPTFLMVEIKNYHSEIRTKYPYSNSHEFIFVTEKAGLHPAGYPLATNTVNKIFKVLSSALKHHVHPHILRYQWNITFDAICEQASISGDEKDSIRKEAMGWSRDSTMPQLYNRINIIKEMQRALKWHHEVIHNVNQ
ncbi:TPA: tyrosine-type recombinase/integrase [Citrobacter freundii]|nr:tyrosine-type recombinase/integrase [Citrobacter freundii]